MKIFVLLVLCFAVVLGEKKINLEDIERDNLQSEAQSEQESAQTEETKYNSDKADAHLQYSSEPRLIGGQQPQEVKYVVQPDAYNQDLQAYQQQQHSPLLSTQQQPPQYYATGYQTETSYQGQKSSPQISYQPQLTQGLSYQSEIPIGNQIQSYQQKVVTEKFSNGIGKAQHYANVPASGNQQLLYYPTPSIASSSKNQVQPLLHRLATQAAQNVRLPAYTTSLSHGPKISYQPQPQIQYVYEPQYVPSVKPTHAPKSTQKIAYATSAVPQTYASPQSYSGLTYNQQNPLYNQQKLAYTQAYYIQPQSTQYYQEPAYTPALRTHQGNSLSYVQSQPFYLPSNLAQQLASRILEQQSSHSIAQNYAKIPEEPHYRLTVPQIPAQKFKSGPITQLRPVHSEISYANNHLDYSSGPKSLLDSYVPSHVIAAQDSERYQERPLHLESGFLPSKGSYTHSYNQKRKSE